MQAGDALWRGYVNTEAAEAGTLDLADAAYWAWQDLRETAVVAASRHEDPDMIRQATTAQRRSRIWDD